MAPPSAGEQPPALRRAGRIAGRFSLALLAFGTAVMSFGIAVGIGLRLDGDPDHTTGPVSGRGESVALRDPAKAASEGTLQPTNSAASLGAPSAMSSGSEGLVPGQALQRFHAALRELEAGQRTRPVSVLHLGDGHVFGDRLDTHMRSLLQGRFGDAGRGLLQPAGIIKGYRTRGLRLEASPGWTVATATETAANVLGVSGVQVSAASAQAEMSVAMLEGRFDAIEVAFLAGPDRGAANILVDGRPHSVVTRAPEIGVQRARLPSSGATLAVRPAGTGPITILSWSLNKSRPGVRYSALGLPNLGIDAIERLDELVLIDDLRALKPDLVLFGFGTSEGLDDRLDVGRYQERFTGLLRLFKKLLPEAALVVVGPPDVNRVPEFAARLRTAPATGCQALSSQERQEHDALVAAADDRLARWYTPPHFDDVRFAQAKAAAANGALYWDWSKVMGGPCGMHAWVHAKPELAMPDHLTLTDAGYQRSARALHDELLQGYSATQAAAAKSTPQR